jgi:hypothetical protein
MLRRRVDRVDRVCRILRRETSCVRQTLGQPRPDRYKRPLPAQEDAFKAALRKVGNTSIRDVAQTSQMRKYRSFADGSQPAVRLSLLAKADPTAPCGSAVRRWLLRWQ